MDFDAVTLSRLQFAITALYHFLFVPLTLGLSIMLGIFESIYVMTNKIIWRQITQFWGILFGINFAMGVSTGLPLEFQFGMNWSYYSHYVGDIFGSLLAIEGLMAFFLEATFIGLFFFAWDRLSKVAHLCVTWGMALATNFSALWILIANAWMQNPVGSQFNTETLRMELTSFYDVFFNPVAQSKFVHTVSAGYVTGAVFVLSLSAYYLLKGKHVEVAKRSMTVAASFGLAAALSVVVLGDESGYTTTQHQKMKLAAMEGLWESEGPLADLTLFAIPDTKAQKNHYEIKAPWLLGLIATRSFSEGLPGIKELYEEAVARVEKGKIAYGALERYKENRNDLASLELLRKHEKDLGHGLLLKKFTNDPTTATNEMVQKAAKLSVPNVPALFWSFRIMVAIGIFLVILFAYSFYLSAKRRLGLSPTYLKFCIISLPLPWIAAEFGWFLAEYGRQPWTIDGILPTFLSASSVPAESVLLSLSAFILFYSILAVIELKLMAKYIKLGPNYAA